MRKSILAIAAAGSVFALTAAGATGLTVTSQDVKLGNSGSDVSISTTTCAATVGVDYTYTDVYHTNISAVVLTLGDTSCDGQYVKVTLTDNAGTPNTKDVYSTALSGTSKTISVSPSFDVSTNHLASVDIAITPVDQTP